MKEYEMGFLCSQIGGRYLGISIQEEDVEIYLQQFDDLVGREKYTKLTENQARRDGGEHHVTLLSPQEYEQSNHDNVDKYIGQKIGVEYVGLGKVKKGQDEVYFVVVKSSKGDEIRRELGLPDRDFHITLGFKSKDIFGVKKDESTLVLNT